MTVEERRDWRAAPFRPMRDAFFLVIIPYYSESNGETYCFGKIVPAVT